MDIGVNGRHGHTAIDRVVLGMRTGSGRAQTLARCMVGKNAKEKIISQKSATQSPVKVRLTRERDSWRERERETDRQTDRHLYLDTE